MATKPTQDAPGSNYPVVRQTRSAGLGHDAPHRARRAGTPRQPRQVAIRRHGSARNSPDEDQNPAREALGAIGPCSRVQAGFLHHVSLAAIVL